jgi:outer membrane receptor protein involved in Fe transport
MRKRVLSAAIGLLCASMVHAAPFGEGDVTVIVFDRGQVANDMAVLVDGVEVSRTDAAGLAQLSLKAGRHLLTLQRGGVTQGTAAMQLAPGESAEVTIKLAGLGREPGRDIRLFPLAGVDGRISGVVRDRSGSAVAGARVSVDGQESETVTGSDGSFSLSLERGTYDLLVSQSGMQDVRLGNVPALASVGGSFDVVLRTLDVAGVSAPSMPMIEEVTVVGRFVADTAISTERMSESVLDVMSEDQISIAGDSTAADAVARITGITVQNDVVIVRGLGERYSSTLFNGSELPSTDPTRRAIGLGIFPTELISGITVQKTYSADLPGDFSGGVVKLSTRSVPDGFEGKLSVSTGGNTRSTFADGFTHKGGDRDFIGFDDGDRDIPSIAAQLTQNGSIPLSRLTSAENEVIAESIIEDFRWNLREFELPADSSVDFSIGQRFSAGAADIGVSLSGLYDSSWRYLREQRAEILADGQGGQFQGESSLLERTENDVRTGGVFNIVADVGANHVFSFTSLLSRDSLKGTFFEEGFNRSDARDYRSVALEFTESQLLTNQVGGAHTFPQAGDVQFDWQVALSNAKRDEPGSREYTYSKSQGSDQPLTLATGPGQAGLPPLITWEFLDEDTVDASFEISRPASFRNGSIDGTWKVGGRITEREREFESVRWRFALAPGAGQDDPFFFPFLALPSVEQILTPKNVGPNGFRLVNASSALAGGGNADNYTGEHDIYAGYVLGDFDIGSDWRVQAGVRFESSELSVATDAIVGGQPVLGLIDEDDVLPSLNVTWFLTDESQVRFGASQTLNRPQFRELSTNPFRDPETRFEVVGNPDLDQSKITSFDVRYEHYFSSESGFSLAAFYKDLEDPIEVVIIGGGSDERGVRSFANAKSGELYGIELDGSYLLDGLSGISPIFSNVYITGNLSLIESEVEVRPENVGVATNPKRELQGQSPWVANLGLGYSNISQGLDAILLFNMFGERITEAGINQVPDAEEEARALLDFNLKKIFYNDWTVGFKARNLLDSKFEVTQGTEIQRGYRSGREFSVSLSYEF